MFFPLIDEPRRESRHYVEKDVALELISRGCVMCDVPLADPSADGTVCLDYTTTDLYVIGFTTIEAAECELAFFNSHKLNGWAGRVFIVDQKAAVCFKCWIDFLERVVKMKGM